MDAQSEKRRFTYSQMTQPEQQQQQQQPPATLNTNITQNNFKFLQHIGEGSFSEVYHAIEIGTDRNVAIKCCEKLKIKRERKVENIMREKNIMKQISHPLFVQLYYTFQDPTRLCKRAIIVAIVTLFSLHLQIS